MNLYPNTQETMARALSDLRMGVPILVRSADEDLLALSVETMIEERFAALRADGEAPFLCITAWRARTLNVPCYDEDLARVALPRDVDAGWVTGLADPVDDLGNPMRGPLRMLRGGKVDGPRAALRMCKFARLLPAIVGKRIRGAEDLIRCGRITAVHASDVMSRTGAVTRMDRVVSAHVPLEVSRAGRIHVFRPQNGGEEHYAVEIGRPPRSAPILVRLHSACLTGDLLGSLKCDCGPQLKASLQQMAAEGSGLLLYLNQEGRGIGLANKMRAYALQDQGFDTVDANHRLGFEDDERDFRIGASLLKSLGVESIRLLTNNPAKITMMESQGIHVVERVPLKTGRNPFNEKYLNTKAEKSGHIL
ncbi:MAG: GTP cyclohydrolase II [Pseudomonadota bacterium]